MHRVKFRMALILSIIEEFNKTIGTDSDHVHHQMSALDLDHPEREISIDNCVTVIVPKMDGSFLDLMRMPMLSRKKVFLPFWNFLVELEEHDHDQHMLDILADEMYTDTTVKYLLRFYPGIIRWNSFWMFKNHEIRVFPLNSSEIKITIIG